MIDIVNIEKDPKPFGNHKYSLRINTMEICQFTHKREDGLAACLMAAAKQVESNKWENVKQLSTQKEDL